MLNITRFRGFLFLALLIIIITPISSAQTFTTSNSIRPPPPSFFSSQNSQKSGHITPIADLKLEITSNKSVVYRGESISLNYKFSSLDETVTCIELTSKVPAPLSDKGELFFPENVSNANMDNGTIKFTTNKRLNEGESINFSYVSKVVENAPLGYISIPDLETWSMKPKVNYKPKGVKSADIIGSNIYISSSPPTIITLSVDPINIDDMISDSNESLFVYKNASFSLKGYAVDFDTSEKNLKYSWYDDSKYMTSGNNTTIVLSSGIHKITLEVTDEEENKATATLNKDIVVTAVSKEEKEGYYGSITIIFAFFIVILTMIFTKFKSEFGSISKVIGFEIFVLILSILLMIFKNVSIPFFGNIELINIGTVELLILTAIIPVSNYFIIYCFSEPLTPSKSKQYNLKNMFHANKSSEQTNKLLDRIKTDLKRWGFTWYLTMVLMFSLVVLLIWVIPDLSTLDSFNSTTSTNGDLIALMNIQYNYIFWYYSMMTQTFGAILAIIATAATLKKNDKIDPSKIKHFSVLYITIILFCITGLITRSVPPLDPFGPEITITNLIPLFFFEVSLLLAVPALICLGELISRLVE